MHLRFVELFCDVVQHRSFSKAAAAHDVSQSSASQAVHALEERLGTLLIDRSKRPFELTPAGEVYYNGCRALVDGYRAVEDQVLRLRDKVTGPVRVVAIYSVNLLQMDCYLKRFGELYPEAWVRVDYQHPEAVYEQVLHDEADLGLVSFPRDRGEITSIPWQSQPMVLVVPPSHPLAGRESVSVQDISGEDFVGFTTDLTIRKQVDRWLKASRIAVNIVHEFDNIENIKRAVEAGSGVAILPLPTVRREVENHALSALPLSDVQWLRPLGIVHKRHKTLSTAVLKFIELLHQDPATFPRGGVPHPEAGPEAPPDTAPEAIRYAAERGSRRTADRPSPATVFGKRKRKPVAKST